MATKHEQPVDTAVKQVNAEGEGKAPEEEILEAPPGKQDSTIWDDLLKDDDVVVEEPPVEPVKAAEEEPKPPVEEPPQPGEKKEELKPKAEEPKAPEAPPAQPAAAAPPKEPEQPKPQKTREQVAEEHRQWREQAESKLSQYMSQRLTPEEVEELRMEPEKVLPKFVARTYLDVYEAMIEDVQSRIPHVVGQMQVQQMQAAAAEQAFYSAWPSLAKPEYRDVVTRTVIAYRQLNPQASFDQVVQEAGTMASVALRLPVAGTPAKAEDPPAEEPQRPAMSPAAPSARGAPPKAKSSNPFVLMAEEFIEDDKG